MIYSKQAYPKGLFYFLFGFGFVPVIFSLIYPTYFGSWTGHCGMDLSRWVYYDECIRCEPTYILARQVTALLAVLWDWLTLFLYIWKVCSFRKRNIKDKNSASYQSITSTLNRIIIITLSYEFPILFAIVFGDENRTGFLNWFMWISLHAVINYAMFLMQEHNTKVCLVCINVYILKSTSYN